MKTHNHKTHILALCLGCLIIGLNGCKSKQHIAQTQLTHTPTLHKVVEQTLAASPQFTTAEAAKMTLKIDMETRAFSTTARFVIQRDSMFHLSILPLLGIEAFRVEVSPTTALVIDKMNKRYVECQLNEIAATTGLKIGYQELQALICAQMFAIGEPNFFLHPNKNIQVTTANKTHNIYFTCNGFEYEYQVSANSDFQLVSTVIRKENTPYFINVKYSAYQLKDNVLFPHIIEMEIHGGKQTAKCTFTLTKTAFNQPVIFTSTPLNRYTPITIQELLSK